MIDQLKQMINKYPGKWVVGVSGGIDSMCLLFGLVKLGVSPVVAHVNYKKRNPDADFDEEFVRDFCFKNRLSFYCKNAPPIKDGNFQNAARQIRYDWFEEVRKTTNSKWITTAHHQDDQFETLLFRLIRKSALGELIGIQEQNENIIRPLLNVSKSSIEAFVRENNISYREDESNYDISYDRNLIRHQVIPLMDRDFPDWREQISKIPDLAHFFHQSIKEAAEPFINGNGLNINFLSELPEHIHKDVLSYFVREVAGLSVSRDILTNINKIKELQSGKTISLNAEFEFIRDRDYLLIRARNKEVFEQITLNKSDLPLTVELKKVALKVETGEWLGTPQKDVLEIDISSLKFPVKIRQWQDGDRMQPLGMKGSKLVSDILTDNKVSSVLKKNSLVIETFDGKICTVIFGDYKKGVISQSSRCDNSTSKTLMITWNTIT